MAPQLVTPGALVFGDIESRHRNPEHVSRQFIRDVERCGLGQPVCTSPAGLWLSPVEPGS